MHKTTTNLIGIVYFVFFACLGPLSHAGVIRLIADADKREVADGHALVLSAEQQRATVRARQVQTSQHFHEPDSIQTGDSVLLNLFSDTVYTATVDRVSVNIDNVYTVRGRLEGFDYGFALISTSEGKSQVFVHVPELRRKYRIAYVPHAGTHLLREIDLHLIEQPIHGPPLTPPPLDAKDISLRRAASAQTAASPSEPADIDVMVVYTWDALSWATQNSGGIDSLIAQGMETAQLTLDNSGTMATLNLVHTAFVDYTESGDTSIDLRRLTFSAGHADDPHGDMDIVHDWRDTYNADLVVLITSSGGAAGRAWRLSRPEGRPDYGFSVTRVQYADSFTFIHEIGHNFGAGHHKLQNSSPGPGLFDYSAGWRWMGSDANRYCSVMAYAHGSFYDDGHTHTRVARFSNPSIYHQGEATGDAADGDNARTIRETKHAIAAYRPIPWYSLAFEYRVEAEGVTITRYIGDDSNVVIPAEILGASVIEVGHSAFRELPHLVSVYVPDSVLLVGPAAFSASENLSSVTFGNSITYIDDQAFRQCPALRTIRFYGNAPNHGDFVFYDSPDVTVYRLPDRLNWTATWADRPTSLLLQDSWAVFEASVEELRVIGTALKAYKNDHGGELPGRLATLVDSGYLFSDALISVADPTGGTSGGKPPSPAYGVQYPEAYEAGSSYLYEFNEAPCSWYYGGGLVMDVPVGASWAEVKQSQLDYGDNMSQGPYDERFFPVVRNFWFHYPDNVPGHADITVLNLAYDLETVFASSLMWELDQLDRTPDDEPELRHTHTQWTEPFLKSHILHAQPGDRIEFPLWPKLMDLTNLEYRLSTSQEYHQSKVYGDIIGNLYRLTPNLYGPSNIWFTVELWQDDVMITEKSYRVNVQGTRSLRLSDATVELNADKLVLQWNTASNILYQVDTTTNILGEWQLNVYETLGNGFKVYFTNNAGAEKVKYFRLRASHSQ